MFCSRQFRAQGNLNTPLLHEVDSVTYVWLMSEARSINSNLTSYCPDLP